LVVAPLCVCGLKRGGGTDPRSACCGRLRLAGPVGCAPSAWRPVMHRLERLLRETAAAWENAGSAHGERRPVRGAGEETFRQRMRLMCMDWATGYRVMAAVAVDRSCATWCARTNERLTTCGIGGASLVSDRAKALSKRAETGLHGLSLPEVCHLSPDRAQG